LASATVFFQEDFSDGWESRWVQSKVKGDDAGTVKVTAGEYYNDQVKDAGLQTSEDARFYQLSAKFEPFNSKDKTVVIQYTLKNTQDLGCGGAYLKVGPPGLDQENFSGDSEYNIMFGPDKCGSDKKVHYILNYKGENKLINEKIFPESDQLTHVYTAILNPDQTYEVRIDGEVKQSGNIVDDWDLLAPKQIKDPEKSKPEDWVDEPKIDDPEAVKPADWDDIPAEIPDSDAEKPEDWDDELDGEWEPPMIPNPDYKGEWKPPKIDNPDYKGPWEHPMIDNPDYEHDDSIYVYDYGYVGIEIWQVESGTIFDNILIADSVEEAEKFVNGYFKEMQEGEKKAKEELDAAAKEDEDDGDDDAQDDGDDEVEEATGAKDEL
jgi:calreticulin